MRRDSTVKKYLLVDILNSWIVFGQKDPLNELHRLENEDERSFRRMWLSIRLTKHDLPTPPEPNTHSLYSGMDMLK